MTHTTEQERADFEAWYIAGARKAVPAFAEWSDIEVRDGCMRPDGESYKIDTARIAWDAWQASRRAPAAPVPQGWKLVPVELLDRATESLGSFVSDHGWGQADMDTFDDLSALAAAQKPPEAAPVQLPENLREGEPYDNPAFEALARALGVWGTAQSAVCAQFWIAAKEQST